MDTNKMKKKKFFVFYCYGTGGVWYYIYAYSKEAIEKVFPEMYVFETPPKRFQSRHTHVIENDPESYIYDIDNLHGLLKDYVDNEQKDNYNYQHPDKKGPFVDDPWFGQGRFRSSLIGGFLSSGCCQWNQPGLPVTIFFD